MKTKKILIKDLPKGFNMNSALNHRYKDEPLFKEKIEKANQILKTVGLPKTW